MVSKHCSAQSSWSNPLGTRTGPKPPCNQVLAAALELLEVGGSPNSVSLTLLFPVNVTQAPFPQNLLSLFPHWVGQYEGEWRIYKRELFFVLWGK